MKRKAALPYINLRKRKVEKDGFLYTYTLLCTEEITPIFSIAIDLLTPEGDATTATLSQPIYDGGRAALLFEILLKNLVTPIDLPYVMEDILDL